MAADRTLDQLSPAQRDRVVARLRRRPVARTIPPADRETPTRLSFAQERLWFLDQLFPGNVSYHVPSAYRLRGHLDLTALRDAIAELPRRHQVLRQVARDPGDGQPLLVRGPEPAPLAVLTVPGGTHGDRLAAAERLCAAHGRARYDLAAGPLFRAELLRLADDDHVLLLGFHHIVTDHWSLGVLLRELSELYRAYRAGEPVALAAPELQYADYAAWDRGRRTERAQRRQLDYWRDQLAGLTPPPLPADTDRPASAVFAGKRVRGRLSPAATDRLAAVATAHNATLFMAVSAGVAVLLAHQTGRSDVGFASVLANRGLPEVERMVGFFVNTVVLRADLADAPTFGTLLDRMRAATLDAYDNQDVPFESVVRELRPDRALAQLPLANVLTSFLNVPIDPLTLSGVDVEDFFFDPGIVKFDIDIAFSHTARGLAVELDYRRDRFDPTVMAGFTDRLVRLLDVLGADPDRRVSEVPLRTAAEQDATQRWAESGPRLQNAWGDAALPGAVGTIMSTSDETDGALAWRRPDGTLAHITLPAMETSPTEPEPTPDIDPRLVAIWATVLDVTAPDPAVNFFDLGGTSMLAARLVAEVSRAWGRKVRVRALFDHPTLSAFAANLRSELKA